MTGTKEDATKMQRSKYQYYYFVDVERKLRKKINAAKKTQDKQKEAELWDKFHEIQVKRKNTEYYNSVINKR